MIWNSVLVILLIITLVPARRIGMGVLVNFPIGWLVSELAVPLMVLQILLALWSLLTATSLQLSFWGLWLLTVLGLGYCIWQSYVSKSVLQKALQAQCPDITIPFALHWPSLFYPFKMRGPGVRCIADIAYGHEGFRNLLDIYTDGDDSKTKRPILLQIHGGAWMIGRKHQQALPLLNHMASLGWLCIDINYRLSPKAKFPTQLQDVKRAIVWVKQHAAEFGGDSDCIMLTGGSAGGHLASLAALTVNQPQWQPGFEEQDTSVSACVPFYGVYDFLDQQKIRGKQSMEKMLTRYVMPQSPQQNKALWQQASPVEHVVEANIPFFVLHGSHDSLVFVEEARYFVEKLSQQSQAPVCYAELPGAQHAFDIFHSVRCRYTVVAVASFLQWCRR